MVQWENWVDGEEQQRPHKKKKINKHLYCKKNKVRGTLYGSHQYESDSKYCKLCGHKKKEFISDDQEEFEN